MSTPLEPLSALVDGELTPVPDSFLKTLAEDEAMRRRWSRYHLIGEVMREGSAPSNTDDLAHRVAAALEAEPVVLAPAMARPAATASARASGPRRLALAAAVAGVAMVGLWWSVAREQTAPSSAEMARVDDPAATSPTAVEWNQAGQVGQPDVQDFRRRMNHYLVNFNEQREGFAVPNVHPYVRIVGFEQESER